MPSRPLLALALAFVPMIVETMVSVGHERRLRARGAIEPPDDVHALMAVAYPSAFVAMGLEGVWRDSDFSAGFWAGLAIWLVSKGLKYWAIASLGSRWSFRVLVLPGEPLVTNGPYRVLKHPNYVAVMGEFAAMAILCAAPVTGVVGVVVFGALILRRIRVEERALSA